jgi:hypothetical protein
MNFGSQILTGIIICVGVIAIILSIYSQRND